MRLLPRPHRGYVFLISVLVIALRGMTVNAARALGLAATHGALAPGMRADFAVWDVDHPRELAYWIGGRRPMRIVKSGRERNAS